MVDLDEGGIEDTVEILQILQLTEAVDLEVELLYVQHDRLNI